MQKTGLRQLADFAAAQDSFPSRLSLKTEMERLLNEEEATKPIIFNCWNCGAMVAVKNPAESSKLEEARKLIGALVDGETCRMDHHGNCQTHTGGNPCEVEAGRKFLKGE